MSRALLILFALLAAPAVAEDYTVYQFTAAWCQPCQRMQPTIDALAKQGKTLVKVDIDADKELMKRFRVTKVPTFLRVRNGREVKRLVGFQSLGAMQTLFNSTKKDGPSAVVIVKARSGRSGIRGTGCHIGDGYILTCEHVLRKGWTNTVVTSDGEVWEAKLVRADEKMDISLLKVTPAFPVPFVKLTRKSPSVGQKVKMYGMSGSFRAWDGVVKSYQGRIMWVRCHGTIMGDSGGPILLGENIVSIINKYQPWANITMGPCAADIVEFIEESGIKLYKRE